MKRLVILALLAAAVWYGYKRDWNFSQGTSNDVVLVNRSGHALDRIRVTIGGETVVREALEAGATATMPFRSQSEGEFVVKWFVTRQAGEKEWRGGHLIGGPTASRHTFEFDSQNGVIWHAEPKADSR